MMKLIVWSLLGLVVADVAQARSTASASNAPSVSYSRGSFSFHLGYGAEEGLVANFDNTNARYRSTGWLGGIDLRLGGGGPGEFRLMGLAKLASGKDQNNSSFELESNSYIAGLKVFALDWLYFGGGMGAINQTFKSTNADVKTSNPVYLATTGVEFNITGSLYMTLQTFAQVHPIRRTEPITSHSFSEGISAYLTLTYSPPNTSITTYSGR